MRNFNRQQAGITLIEVVIAIAVIASIVIAVGYAVTAYVEARSHLLIDTKAMYLAEEGYEIVRSLRDDDWNTIDSLVNNTVYYLDITAATIAVGTTAEVIDTDFVRSFIVEPVYRNASDDIVDATTPGATIDPGTRRLIMSVASPNGTTTVQAILTNLYAI